MNLDELIREINPVPVDSAPGPESHEARAILERLLTEPERAGASQSSRRVRPGPWIHRMAILAVAAVILAVFFVPLPHVSPFKHLVTPTKPSTPTTTTAPVEIQLVLDRTQVTAGTLIRGEVLLTNTTGRTITVGTCAADGWLSVGLTNHEVSYEPLSPLIACAPTVRLSPGLNRFPITISSDFQGCTRNSSQATPLLPVCTSNGDAPLPAGQYLTRIVTMGLPAGTRLPSAIKVTLLATSAVCGSISFAPAKLSAITFLSATTGLGVWSQSSSCGARLVRTRNGGKTWKVVGGRLPSSIGDYSASATPTMVFPTARVGWVSSGGALVTTRNGGSTWTTVPLGGWVAAISRSGSSLWAFIAPCNAHPNTCSYRLEVGTINSTTFHEVGLLPASLGNFSPLVVTRLNPERALVAVGQMGASSAILTTDAGSRWTMVRACAQSGFVAVAFGSTTPSAAWVLCFGGGSMSSSVKTIERSADGGRTWTIVAADRSLSGRPPSPVPSPDGNVFAVPSTTTMWMATVNSLYGSRDGGKRWFWVHGPSFDGAGTFASFSFVSAKDGWLLAPGSGLWRTTNGATWHSL